MDWIGFRNYGLREFELISSVRSSKRHNAPEAIFSQCRYNYHITKPCVLVEDWFRWRSIHHIARVNFVEHLVGRVKLYGEGVFWSLTVCFEVLHCFAAFLLLAPHCGRFLILSLWWEWYSEAVRIESHCDRWYSLIVISCCTWQRLQRRLWLVVSSVGFNTGCTDSSNITSRLGGEWMQNSRQKVCTLILWYLTRNISDRKCKVGWD